MSRISHLTLRISLLCFLLFFGVSTIFAQEPVTDDEVNEVAKGLFCPVCESEPLDTCPTQACIDWRDEIRVMLSEGQTQSEIYASFRARYGDRVLASPPADGINLILWLTIPIALVVGGIIFSRYLQRISTQPATDKSTPKKSAPVHLNGNHPKTDNDYIRRIEEELNK